MSGIEVVNNREHRRFEAVVGGALAGFSEYELDDKRIIFTHTEVDDSYEGQGVGSVLVRGALDEVRLEGTHRVVPRCPFVKAFIDRHPDYADLMRGGNPAPAGGVGHSEGAND